MGNSFDEIRLRACFRWRYYRKSLMAMTPVPRPGIGTVATDPYFRVYFDQAALDRWSLDHGAGVLVHELCHNLLKHFDRCAAIDADPIAWNVCADAEINQGDLERHLPPDVIRAQELGWPLNEIAEQYYELRTKQAREAPQRAAGFNPAGQPAQSGQSGHQSSSDQSGQTPSSNSTEKSGADAADPLLPVAPAAGGCGSSCTGRPRPWEELPPSGKPGEIPGILPHEADLLRRQTALDIREHFAKSRGTMPGGWKRWCSDLLDSVVNWRQELRSALKYALRRARGLGDYTYSKRNRRQLPDADYLLPAPYSPTPNVMIVIDTSGSMSEQDLAEAVSEVSGVLRALPRSESVRVLAADTQIHAVRRVFRSDQIELLGNGGTDMGSVLCDAATMRPRPDLIVCLTDGETPWPSEPLPMPLLAVITSRGKESAPDWARSIKIDREDTT